MRVLATAALVTGAALLLVGCTAISDEAEPVPTVTTATEATYSSATPASDAAYADAVAAYPHSLPEGYAFPSGLSGVDTADKYWWCAQIDAAWEAYFDGGWATDAVAHLNTAAEVDPGSFGRFESTVPHARRIDRDVRLIDGGVDAQYLEYTAAGCWDWARSVGTEYPPQS